MKLNYKRTFLVGLAFMSICMFWQMYDSIIPLILKNTFHLNDTLSGVIMALDNVIALFLLPLFGNVSDKCNTRIGKRMPFIVLGTAVSVILMTFLPIIDNVYYENPAGGLLTGFIVILALLLIAMGTYRSPAVALMPDVTPKPLRSKANAVINLMGAVGGILYLIVTSVLYSTARTAGLAHVDYQPLFIIVQVTMIAAVVVLYLTIKEPRLVAQCQEYEKEHPEDDLEEVNESGETFTPAPVRRSLRFILISIALWFIGYNAVTTAFTKYAQIEWGMSLGAAALAVTVGTAAAILSYIPIGELASRVGRKKTIIIGCAILAGCFAVMALHTVMIKGFTPAIYAVFVLVGFSWAAINVNSLPMVVEMCKGGEIGKYTGYYYTFSMAAQIVTPILSGALLEYVGYWTLFPYGAVFVALSILTMLQVKHGDNKPHMPKDKLEVFEDLDD